MIANTRNKTTPPSASDALTELTRKAEEGLVGSAILLPRGIPKAASLVTGADFLERDTLGRVWDILVDMSNADEPINNASALRAVVLRRVMTSKQIEDIIEALPNGAMLLNHADDVRRYADLRRITAAAEFAFRDAKQPDGKPTDILDRFQASVDAVGSNRDAGFVHLSDSLSKLVARAENPESWTAWETPFPKLNTLTGGGLLPGQLWLIGGRTGRGKTAIAMNLASYLASAGLAVWYASLEMEDCEIAERYVSASQRISMNCWSVQNGKSGLSSGELASLKGEAEQSKRVRFWLTDEASETMATIMAKAKLRRSAGGLDVVIIDNLNILTPTNPAVPRHEQLKAMTVHAKKMAKDLNVAVVMLSQLAIDAETEDKKTQVPSNRWWADSKRIIDDADVACLLHEPNPQVVSDMELHVMKARRGRRGDVPLHWDGQYQTFTERQCASGYAGDFADWSGT
jgi:replicative DNA helicase